MTEEDEKGNRNNNIYQFCEKNIECDKVRNHCLFFGRDRGPAHNKCNTNVTQKQSNFFPFPFHTFSNYDCHMFF